MLWDSERKNMATSLYTLITQLVNAHFTDDNASFESVLLSIIRVVSADTSKIAQKNAHEMAHLLKEHQAGMSATMYTRSVSREMPVSDEEFYQVVSPKTRLDDLVLSAEVMDQVQSIILSRKNRYSHDSKNSCNFKGPY